METLTSLPVSTVIILGTHLGTLPVAHWFSRYNSSEKSLWLSKHRVAALLGLATILICYQWSALQLILQWLISYTLLHTVPKHQLGKISFVILYGHVIVVNAFKFIYKYGDISLDYTGSMMLGTMRLTSLAFSIQDSTKPEEKLTELQKQRVMKQDITLEKHFCYCFSFIGILFGPFIFYEDHEKYMNKKSSEFNANNYKATLTLLQGVLALIIVIVALPHYPVEKNFDPEVLASGILYKHWILYITMFIAKCRYYFAWLTAQAAAIYAGYDAEEDSNITATVNPLKIELTTSLKQFIDNWNMFTAKWLRYTCFERLPSHKALVTFVVSALWHGFLPGYMIMFVPLAFYTAVGQKLHKVVLPKFQSSDAMRTLYALVTWVGAAVTICFNGTGFQLLFTDKIWLVQSGLYFYPHIIALLLFVVLPSPTRKPDTSKKVIINGAKHSHQPEKISTHTNMSN